MLSLKFWCHTRRYGSAKFVRVASAQIGVQQGWDCRRLTLCSLPTSYFHGIVNSAESSDASRLHPSQTETLPSKTSMYCGEGKHTR